ncbi:unnamed protein product [Rotaria sp. Silwood2]|nr:unnamed protein product [Rotaria sp. Silwood2]CAF4591786.1 unnamed protein product [Rotaria sp. Silwood2]
MASKYVGDQESQRRQRYSDIDENPRRKLIPISGYEAYPIVTLEEAVEPLKNIVGNVKNNAEWAKWKCEETPEDNLTVDQSAAIILYTMEPSDENQRVYYALNSTLRDEDRKCLKPWFLYLRLLLSALALLPSLHTHVYRGFMHFRLEHTEQRSIPRFNRTFPHESEVLLPAARCFMVIACLPQGTDMTIIQLKEIDSPVKLIDLGPEVNIVPSTGTGTSNTATASITMSLSTLKIDKHITG